MTKHDEIKTMKLYQHLDRIEKRIKIAGPTSGAVADGSHATLIDPELLGTMDCLHFFGDEPIQKVQQLITAAGGAEAQVLDIGTGYGGSARLLAHRMGCHVDALELQPDLSAVAQALTTRCGLQDRVTHLTGDFMLRAVDTNNYNVIVGLLCFLHIGQWRALFTRCFESLKPGGVLYVEDFFQRGVSFTQEDFAILRNDMYCAELLTHVEMRALLEEIGFEIVAFVDVSEKWAPYVATRAVTYAADLDKHMETDGEEAAKALNHFYTSVAKVFAQGNLGGYTLSARRPANATNTSEQP